MKKIAILQSNYIPWKGYFDIINSVDEFVIYDTEQYTRRDWRNRNLIKTKDGLKWLTIPVKVKEKYYQKINEVEVADKRWAEKHWKTIENSYRRAEYFTELKDLLLEAYRFASTLTRLSEINDFFIQHINKICGIKTKISRSEELKFTGKPSEKIISICKQLGANIYISGPAAKQYLDVKSLKEHGIDTQFFNYSKYREYRQLYPPFIHEVSVLDLLFNRGHLCREYLIRNN